MSKWIHKTNVEFVNIYKRIGHKIVVEYLIELRVPKEDSMFHDIYSIKIDDRKFKQSLIELKENKINRCCFAYGMENIDFYKTNDKYAITHSPYCGLNVQLIFADGEFEKLINTLELEDNND